VRVRFVYGLVPVPVLYTERLPGQTGGRMLGWLPLVLIRPKYANDEGLHQHQLVHVRQWWFMFALMAWMIAVAVRFIAPHITGPLPREALFLGIWLSCVTHAVVYQFSPAYRVIAEVMAYRAQMRFRDRKGRRMPLESAVSMLTSDRYRLGITESKARQLLGL
jgi:hypothetical protein